MPSKEERGVKTDDSKEMSEADCRELWKLIKEMDKAFTELFQEGKLKHGSGLHTYPNFGIKL